MDAVSQQHFHQEQVEQLRVLPRKSQVEDHHERFAVYVWVFARSLQTTAEFFRKRYCFQRPVVIDTVLAASWRLDHTSTQ
jgi:hypothetical protein